MYGEVNIGSFTKQIQVSLGFYKHSGIRNATLHNVTIGDDCLIENIGNFINNYTIGNECYISNVGTIETTEAANYGQCNTISILNEAGEQNVMLFSGLTSQLAAYMIAASKDKEAKQKLFQIIREDVMDRLPERGVIGDNVNIINTRTICNCLVYDYVEIKDAEHLSDSTIIGDGIESAFIGSGAIIENSIVDWDATVNNGAKVQDCYVGEACQITNGFTASSSVFFANSVMCNGEACAAFCGPFTASHHKGSLLIGGQFSFYNAGSSTNFSNHAYKMGPIHWGILDRGTKTASGAYLFMPAHIGAYSVCLGKTMTHPDTSLFPFSYLIGKDDKTILKPGRNLTTVGLYRDIKKWPKRDVRVLGHRNSLINQDWLSPFVAQKMMEGKKILQQLILSNGDAEYQEYSYEGVVISNHDAHIGIEYYDAALKMYMGKTLEDTKQNCTTNGDNYESFADGNTVTDWIDLGGMLTTADTMYYFTEDIKNGKFKDTDALHNELEYIYHSYQDVAYSYAYQLILAYYQLEEITEDDAEHIKQDAEQAKQWWLEMIEKDAHKEYTLGDVEEQTYNNFVTDLWSEIKKENKL